MTGKTLYAITAICLALVWLTQAGCPQTDQFQYRWFYLSTNFLVDENVPEGQQLLRRADRAGYNGVLLSDYKFGLLDRMPKRYFDNVGTFRSTADDLGIEIVPCVMPIGYSGSLLSHDPNLAEGIPVKEALFVARDGTADIVPDPPVELPNGDFEQSHDHTFPGWNWQDNAGESIFADSDIVHRGRQSCRMQDIGRTDPEHGHCRLQKVVDVSPFRCYHLQAWIRTEDFEATGGIRAFAMGTDGRVLSYNSLGVKHTQDWTCHHVVFNSLDHDKVRIYIGVWGGKRGKLWWDDVELEEVGLPNVLRRDGCPLTVTGQDGTVYEEGRDFHPVQDERMGCVPWPGSYEVYHDPPLIHLTEDSNIPDGARLRVSFYHPIIIHSSQVTCCLSEPKVYDILRDQVQRVEAMLRPKAYFMSHDEIRVANWCDACRSRNMTPGELLADNVERCTNIIRDTDPEARIFVWSDMFDPNHNAHDDYYLVNGTWAGSWQGLDEDVIIANWYFAQRENNLPWFAKRGHTQVLAGYYDSDQFYTDRWLAAARRLNAPVVGVIYTTWRNQYGDLEGWAEALWGSGG